MTFTASPRGPQALVFGASGITGWAITNSALSYPTRTTFSYVIGLTSRPLTQETARFASDPRLELNAGLDLSEPKSTAPSLSKKATHESPLHTETTSSTFLKSTP